MNKTLKIGTRGSPLALTQTEMVRAALAQKHTGLQTEIVVIKTSGDWEPAQGDARLCEEQGGKGLFAKEIEAALLAGEIDCAVHSMKDMDSHLPDGLVIEHMLPRHDPRDCIIFSSLIKKMANFSQLKSGEIVENLKTLLWSLPESARIGTSSVRRAAFLKNVVPDLVVEPLRGNVQTRIDKLLDGQVDAIVLALAGLERLGLSKEADLVLAEAAMLPSAGQGAVGIEIRAKDAQIAALFDPVSCVDTVRCVKAEREVLRILDGSCHTPIAAHGVLAAGVLMLRAVVVSPDGAQMFRDEISGPAAGVAEAEMLGKVLGLRLKARIPVGIFE